MPPKSAPSQIDAIWWLHPGKLVLFFMLPIYLFVTFVVPALWPELIVLRARVYMDAEYVLLGASSLLLLGGGALLGSRLQLGPAQGAPVLYHVRERFLLGMGILAAAAYLIWFWPAIARGELLLERDELNQTPGVTSFTQLGVPFVVCYLYAARRAGQQFSRPLRLMFRTLLVFTVLRVYMWSERLALIEIAVPCAVLLLAFYKPQRPIMRTGFNLVRRYGPFLGIPVLFFFFGVTEVVRSWTSYSQKQDITLVDFIISRIATYYYTALNNGAGMLATSNIWPTFEFLSIGEWVYRLPFGIGLTFWNSLGRDGMPHDEFLRRFADVEFNNMSGIYPVFYDVGITLGLLYFGGLGVLMGLAYGEAKRGRRLGTLIFPSMLVACIEVLRIMYLNNTRCFLVFVGAVLAATQMRPARNESPRPAGQPVTRAIPSTRLTARRIATPPRP